MSNAKDEHINAGESMEFSDEDIASNTEITQQSGKNSFSRIAEYFDWWI